MFLRKIAADSMVIRIITVQKYVNIFGSLYIRSVIYKPVVAFFAISSFDNMRSKLQAQILSVCYVIRQIWQKINEHN